MSAFTIIVVKYNPVQDSTLCVNLLSPRLRASLDVTDEDFFLIHELLTSLDESPVSNILLGLE